MTMKQVAAVLHRSLVMSGDLEYDTYFNTLICESDAGIDNVKEYHEEVLTAVDFLTTQGYNVDCQSVEDAYKDALVELN